VRVEELINYFDYGYAPPADRTNPFSTYVALAPSPWSAQKQILHIGIQGFDLPRAEAPPLNLVFLVDTSGSMWGPDRLPLAQKSLNLLVDQMRPQDRVSIVAYAGSAGAVLEPTDGRSKLKVRCALGALQAGGSTAGGQGLKLAYDLARQNFDTRAVNRVILVTDGDFNVGIADPARLKDFVTDQRKTGVYLSVYGFGRGNYNDAMMQALAQNGNGTAAYVDSLQEARKLFRTDFTSTMFPIADDVKIQVEFNPAQVSEYRLIGYETRMLAREDFNNDQVDAVEVGAGPPRHQRLRGCTRATQRQHRHHGAAHRQVAFGVHAVASSARLAAALGRAAMRSNHGPIFGKVRSNGWVTPAPKSSHT